ncbi:response regulator transcription factor [Streptomyces sp. NBC_00316]|uniref:response regulator transcription factor n=1 Tax=Streptomyces sp. NBC_00316 TaxID=2975710 RepID=UPI002E2E8847|nr:response regulator transcription factor [Streptomyces sp. NBC_00316]
MRIPAGSRRHWAAWRQPQPAAAAGRRWRARWRSREDAAGSRVPQPEGQHASEQRSGFLLKDVTAQRLFDAVRVIAAGQALLAPTVTRRLIREFAGRHRRPDPAPPAALAALTPRETEVLRLVAEGLSNPEVATRLLITEETVETHVSRILAKLALRDRTQAVVTAYESGLVIPGSRD